MTRVAAIDCGTNSIRLLVADIDDTGRTVTDLDRRMEIVRLGAGVDRTGRLSSAAVERTTDALRRYAEVIDKLGAERVRMVATSATRDAANRDEFAAGIQEVLGVEPQVASGAQEAALSFARATRDLLLNPRDADGDPQPPFCVVDLGGGSTEIVLGYSAPTAALSVDVGCVRITERHLHSDPPTGAEIAVARATIDAALDSLPDQGVDLRRARTVVAVSGTGLTVAAAVLDLPWFDRARLDGAVVPVAGVNRAVGRLLAMTVAERRALPYMHPGRADVIGAGALILDQVLGRTSATEVRVSVSDILDGIAWSCV